MKKLAIWVSKPYQNDELFRAESPLNRDDCLASFHRLREELLLQGGRCHTQDIYVQEGSSPDVVLYLDIPGGRLDALPGSWNSTVRKWLVLQESEVVIPRNWDLKRHEQFERIFTWNDELVDGIRYFKWNYTNPFPTRINLDISKKTKLCVLIAGNKTARHPLELYSKRIEAIRWFERNHPSDFDLYGVGWNEYLFTGPLPARVIKALNRLKPLRRMLAVSYPSYRGKAESKRDVLGRYRFSICYENARDIPGYITEKIFDCFFAGCVPVYWGAGNITDHIPADCFIDKRNFPSYEELYDFLVTMGDSEYLKYLKNIDAYLASEKAYQFSIECFAKTIADGLMNG